MKNATDVWERFKAGSGGDPKLYVPSPRRVRVHVPAHDGWPESVRGVGSEIRCAYCGKPCRGRSHAEARKALRMHRLDAHT